jgi:hypothetical protein
MDVDLIRDLDRAIQELVDRFGTLAFWGVNSYIYALFEKLEAGQGTSVVCVDKSALRHGVRLGGGRVQPPAVIREKNIPCVVIAVAHYAASLRKPIADEFPHVRTILSISELLDKSLVAAVTGGEA